MDPQVKARQADADAESELRKLREMDAFKTQFLNMAAHELNTPLTPLRLQMHMLLAGHFANEPDKQRLAIEVASRNVDRVTALVKEILDVARLQGGGLRFTVESFDVSPAVLEVVASYAAPAQAINVKLDAVAPSIIIKTDRSRFIQVLMNLSEGINRGSVFTLTLPKSLEALAKLFVPTTIPSKAEQTARRIRELI